MKRKGWKPTPLAAMQNLTSAETLSANVRRAGKCENQFTSSGPAKQASPTDIDSKPSRELQSRLIFEAKMAWKENARARCSTHEQTKFHESRSSTSSSTLDHGVREGSGRAEPPTRQSMPANRAHFCRWCTAERKATYQSCTTCGVPYSAPMRESLV